MPSAFERGLGGRLVGGVGDGRGHLVDPPLVLDGRGGAPLRDLERGDLDRIERRDRPRMIAGPLPLLGLAERDEGDDGQDHEGPERDERFLVHSF